LQAGFSPGLGSGAVSLYETRLSRGEMRSALAAKGERMSLILILVILLLVFGFGGYRLGPGLGYYGGGGISLIILIVIILLLLRVI
jgi:uncharacterized protein DUF3309